MATRCVYNVLAFLRDNVRDGLESLEDARSFVKQLDGLTRDELLYLEISLLDSDHLECFYASLCESSEGCESVAEGSRHGRRGSA